MSSLPSATPSPSPPPPPPPPPAENGGVAPAVGMEEVHDDDNSAYFNSLPPGYRFCPYDAELIDHYLLKKVKNEPVPMNRIQEVELYKHEPEYFADRYSSYGDKEWYFFTPRDRKYRNGNRPNRAAGNGYWKATGSDREIQSNGKHVGYRKSLVFYHGKAPKGQKSNWIMQEYRVKEGITNRTSRGPNDMKLDDCVLCKIYRKPDKALRELHNAENQEEEDVDVAIGNDDRADGYENSEPANTPNCYNDEVVDYTNLINPPSVGESNHSLQYDLAPLPESYNLFPDNFSYKSNISFGYGDPVNLVEPISFKPPMQPPTQLPMQPPMHFTEDMYQPRNLTGPANDEYWGFRQVNYDMFPQLDFTSKNYYLNPWNFAPVDDIFTNTTRMPPSQGGHPDTTEMSPFPRDQSK